jgi:transcriptional regulator with XRE-family HTH domain
MDIADVARLAADTISIRTEVGMSGKEDGQDREIPFRRVLASIQRERGLTLGQMAHLAGVGKSVVHSWLAGASPQNLRAVSRLAKALGLSLEEILLGERPVASKGLAFMESLDEQEVLNGLCRVNIVKLIPRQAQEGNKDEG